MNIDENQIEQIMNAQYEDEREERQFKRINELERRFDKLEKEVAALVKSALGGKSEGKSKDKERTLDEDIIDAVVCERIW
jgi:hypothetical protein